jgi:DNA processing protein
MNAAEDSFDGSCSVADMLRLSLVPGVGPVLRKALLDQFGSAARVLDAAPSELRLVPGVGQKLSLAIARAREQIDAESELELCRQHGIGLLSDADDAYPRVLREIYDPPGVLFVQGRLLPQDALSVAIVGSRHATQYGIAVAEKLAGSLTRAGLTIISGLARGIDAAAHRGAISAGGRTLAVLGSGLLNIYPPEHRSLASEVAAHGALLAEVPPRSQPLRGVFPQRNRIISGLSLGVIIVEAALGSGALITARHAMEQNREVFAVPGRVDSRMSRGCHRLIRDGAKLIETADDVLEELAPLVAPAAKADGQPIHHPAELLLNEMEQRVLSAIDSGPTLIDQVVVTSGLSAPQVLATLSVLEMRRVIRRLSGSTVCRI